MIKITVNVPNTHTNYELNASFELVCDATMDDAVMAFAKALQVAGYSTDYIPQVLRDVADALAEGYEVL